MGRWFVVWDVAGSARVVAVIHWRSDGRLGGGGFTVGQAVVIAVVVVGVAEAFVDDLRWVDVFGGRLGRQFLIGGGEGG